MKKTAIILALFIAVLSGCGRVDSVDVDGEIKPFEIEQTTQDENSEDPENTDIPVVTGITTASDDHAAVTTMRTGAVNLVKRSGVVTTARVIPPSRGTVVIPSRGTTPRPSNNTSPSTTTVATRVSTAPVTTAPPIEDHLVVSKDDLSCHVKNGVIEIVKNGVSLQTVEISTDAVTEADANGNTEERAKICICDFDFDGNDDIFIPQEIGEFNTLGVFKRYDPNTGKFENWSEIEAITGYVVAYPDDQSLSFTSRKNEMEYEVKNFKWNDDKTLSAFLLKRQYKLEGAEPDTWDYYVDTFEYPNGNETIVKREKLIFNDDNEIVGTQEVDIEWETR